jgi:hypothetical protein
MADDLEQLQAEIAAMKSQVESCNDGEERKMLRKERELLLKKELLLLGLHQGSIILNAQKFLFGFTAFSVGIAPFGLGAF